ncbi:DUF3048 C-terminal domain-containing protein [Actinokineospora soli]|uniref:DUF3048 C-terminal domain-containing protein n=1 Tax=Actinokineospora soli TaxID=1048753 RepID=A0ABW2TRK6_9PSEU
MVSLDGTPLTSTESGRVGAATVVHQRVKASADESVEDASGFRSPVVTGIGEGSAVVLRDGKRFAVTWSRPSAASPTTFHTAAGDPVPLAPGPVWILLTPA